jgi:hypothetical protein
MSDLNESTYPNLNQTLDEYLDNFGILIIYDYVFFFVIPTVSFVGLILNTFNVCIFAMNCFKMMPAFTYYRIISIVGVVHTFTGIFYGFCNSIRYMPFKFQYSCEMAMGPYIFLHNALLFYCGLLEAAALVDRLKVFSATVRIHFTFQPKNVCLILLIISPLICIFDWFVYQPELICWYSYSSENYSYEKNCFYILVSSEFSLSQTGFIVIISFYIVQTIPLVLLVVLNGLLLWHLRNYTRNSMVIRTASNTESNRSNAIKSMTMMAIFQTIISMLSRVVLIVSTVWFILESNKISNSLLSLTDLLIFVEASYSFFAYLIFNKLFRKSFFNIFKLRTQNC